MKEWMIENRKKWIEEDRNIFKKYNEKCDKLSKK
jgi:hypothetical protein